MPYSGLVRKDKLKENKAMRMEVPPASAYRGVDFFVDSEIPLRVIHVESGLSYPDHTHDFHELVLICGGSGLHRTGGTEYEVRRADVFLIPRGASHGYEHTKNFDYINIVFDAAVLFDRGAPAGTPDSFDPSSPTMGGLHRKLSAFGFREILSLFNRIDQELLHRRIGYAGMIRALFAEAWCLLARECLQEYEERSGDPHTRVKWVIRYLEREGGPNVSVADMASEAGMSVRNFHRVFRGITGKPPLVYINGLRIRRARSLLEETDLTVTQIAGLVGFDDSNYFTKLFKNIVGVAPRLYRNQGGLK